MAPDLVILRDIFYRLVFFLQLDTSISMEIIAFWLFLEANNGDTGFLERVDSFDDDYFQAVAFAGKNFVETLNPDLCDLGDRSIIRSPFQQEATEGIAFYLNNVCYMVLEDLHGNEEMEEFPHHICQANKGNMNDEVPLSTEDLLSKIKSFYASSQKNHGEGPSCRSAQYPRNRILQDIEVAIDEYASTSHLAPLLDDLSLREKHNDPVMQQQPSEVPQDERTLFVTFSNGYPLSKDELYDFFMRHYGDIEDITIEEPPEPRPPLFAQVTFYSQLTLRRVLDGNKRVKFMTRGKHLWARQFVPKKKKPKNDELNLSD
uniref:RRM domain-containing protein n=1 Tax=Leersia perrieri TaxID=77586 RepID=A0A0D9WXL2_9ORYZ